MYPASADFHNAVKNGNPQMPLLIFPDAVFTAGDIDVNAGIEFDDLFNTEENISIGQALMNNIRFTLFNDNQLLNDYEFGQFIATIGVRISVSNYTNEGIITVESGDNTYVATAESPYLTRNGSSMATAPSGEIANIIIYDDKVYCFQTDGTVIVYKDSTGEKLTVTVPAFMSEKFKREFRYGAYFANNILTLNQSEVQEIYEFVPLGTFIANRPDAPSVSQINMSCDDQMKKFDQNLPDDTTLGITYPTTIGNLYKKMCEYLNVPYETDTFINSTATIAKRPSQFESVTMRQVLQWIAEAAGSNAKFDRDGILCLKWLNTTTAEFSEGDYSAFSPFWYETQQVDKLYNRNSQGGADGIYGSGNGGYLILDNPLMKGAN